MNITEPAPGGPPPIQGAATSVAVFLGACQTGIVNAPVQVRSLADFSRQFGSEEIGLGRALSHFFQNGGQEAWISRVPDSGNDEAWKKAFATLDELERFNLLLLPGISTPAVLEMAKDYGSKRRVFLILDAPGEATTPDLLVQWLANSPLRGCPNAAVYFPWLEITHPGTAAKVFAGPSAAVAGIFARTDRNRGVWKSPANENVTLAGLSGLQYAVDARESERLNALGINCLRTFAGRGLLVWGARTLAGADAGNSEWKYVSVRRLALFIEESIDHGTQWAVFEPNGEPLWTQIRLQVGTFMQELFYQGAFQGSTPREAYYVRCDANTTSPNDLRAGLMNIEIGFAALKPAEFMVIRMQKPARANP